MEGEDDAPNNPTPTPWLCVLLPGPMGAARSWQPAATLAHATCVASMGGTTYVSAGFTAPYERDARGEQSYHTMVTWGRAFADYVEQKYGPGSASGNCGLVATIEQAQGGVEGRTASAKRLMQKVVETDWVHKSVTPSTLQSAQPATSAAQTPPPNANIQSTTMLGVCWSDLNGPPVVYVSQMFDTKLGRPDKGEDMFAPISNEFHQYLCRAREPGTAKSSKPVGS